MKKLLIVLAILGILAGGCAITPNGQEDPHRYEDITGPDDTEDWW